MKCAAIISEYNPFHNGHKYQLDLLKSEGFDVIFAVMSGSVVQRGETAIFDKYTRAAAAVASGVDFVVELPAPFSGMSAEYFAEAGTFAAESLGADVLSFGSECGDLDMLAVHASKTRIASPDTGAAKAEYGETGFSSNDILAVEYIRAIKRNRYRLEPLPHKRTGDSFDCEECLSDMPSATALRRLISEGKRAVLWRYMPKEAYSVIEKAQLCPSDTANARFYSALRTALCFKDVDELSTFCCLGGGLASRMRKAAEKASTLEEFYSLAATKVYTNARIRRASVFAVCGISASAADSSPEYLSLLAANKRGRQYISENKSGIPILTTVREKSVYASFEYEKRFDILHSSVRSVGSQALYYLRSPIILQI